MKQLFFLFSFLLFSTFSANAQCNKSATAGKACCASKKTAAVSTTEDTKVASALMEADALIAASNGNITKRSCEMSGVTTYFEKSVCAVSGNVSWEEVKFDADKKEFTKVASASMEKDENGNKVETKACAGKSAGKACCKKDGAAKACAGSKAGTK